MSNLAKLLRDTAEAIRPHIEQTLDLREIFADYRKAVTDAGGDWMALKNLVKARIEDERDETGAGERVARIVERADLASAYADMLGLNANLNENNSFEPERPTATAAVAILAQPEPAKHSDQEPPQRGSGAAQDRLSVSAAPPLPDGLTIDEHGVVQPPPLPEVLRRRE